MKKTARYYKGIRLETPIIKVFQKYIENKKGGKTFLKKRQDSQASIDFLGKLYNDKEILSQLAVEVRSLSYSKEDIEKKQGFIEFPISKLNEAMKFWRMGKEVYIVYLLKDTIFFLNWDYYLKHNFEIKNGKQGYYLKLPIKNFKYCGDLKKLED